MQIPADLADRVVVSGEFVATNKAGQQSREPLQLVLRSGATVRDYTSPYHHNPAVWIEKNDDNTVAVGSHNGYGSWRMVMTLA